MLPENYKERCIETVNKHIKENIRHLVIIEDLQDYNAIEFDFEVNVINALSICNYKKQ